MFSFLRKKAKPQQISFTVTGYTEGKMITPDPSQPEKSYPMIAPILRRRNKKLTMDDLSGGTYTFTNNGSFGILAATPVILQPQVGIFCVGTIKKKPIVTEDLAIAIRDMMYATHTFDHRLIDGELGSRFLRHVVNTLQTLDPKSLF